MSVSVAGIPKNRCRTTVAEPIGERERNYPLPGTKSVCLGRNQAARDTFLADFGEGLDPIALAPGALPVAGSS